MIYISHINKKKGRSRRNKQNIANGTYGNLRGVRCVISSFSHLIKSLLVCSITLYKRYDARINKIENRKKIVMKIVNAENKVKDFKSFQEMMICWIWEDINPYFIHNNIIFRLLIYKQNPRSSMINPKIVETKTRIFSRHFSGRGTSNIKY